SLHSESGHYLGVILRAKKILRQGVLVLRDPIGLAAAKSRCCLIAFGRAASAEIRTSWARRFRWTASRPRSLACCRAISKCPLWAKPTYWFRKRFRLMRTSIRLLIRCRSFGRLRDLLPA